MEGVSIHEAKTHFSRLVARAESGEEIIVRRGRTPVAKLVGYRVQAAPRTPGALNGQVEMAEDFDAIPAEFVPYTG